jgi:aldehyde dehydrogenase (NAD+)
MATQLQTGKFYINGQWVAPASVSQIGVVNPATGEVFTSVAAGSTVDVDRAVRAAKEAFPAFSRTSRQQRIELLQRVADIYERRKHEIAAALIEEGGFPRHLAEGGQIGLGTGHFAKTIEALKTFLFEEVRGTTLVAREGAGVIAAITPWNWPINQIVCKVAPALAAGATLVLKPSELTPLNALIIAEIFDEAGVPPGVFNLVNGDGPTTGAALAAHPDVDVVSFTGSTRAGTAIAKAGADTVKRIHQELGGKSPFIVLRDADLRKAVTDALRGTFLNSGQSCNAPTRLLVPRELLPEVEVIAIEFTKAQHVGLPKAEGIDLGPVISDVQKNKIQRLIQSGIDEGAKLLIGGVGAPEGLERGFFVRPTVFSEVLPKHTIFQEEIFGPVQSISAYDDVEHAIELANDTPYGLAGYVHGRNLSEVREVASRIRAGTIYLNSPQWDFGAPFGGYKTSGNGREYADFAIHDFTEIKGVVGYQAS